MGIKYQFSKKSGRCAYEDYNKELKRMQTCGRDTKIKRGQKYVCCHHLSYVLSMDRNVEMINVDLKTVRTKAQFIQIAYGIE